MGAVSTEEVRQGSSGRRHGQDSGKGGRPSLAKLCHVGSEEKCQCLVKGHHQLLLQLGSGVPEVMTWDSQLSETRRKGEVHGSPTELVLIYLQGYKCPHRPRRRCPGPRTVTMDTENPS